MNPDAADAARREFATTAKPVPIASSKSFGVTCVDVNYFVPSPLGFGARKGKMTRRSKAADGDPPRPREAFARRLARALQPSPVRSRPRGRTSS